MSNVIKLAIGFPAYGSQVHASQARMWTELGNAVGASPERFRLALFGYADLNPVDKARNYMIAYALTHSADWLFTIDADTWVEHSKDEDAGFQILRMISEADRIGAWLVSAAVVKRADQATMELAARGIDAHELAVYGQPKDGNVHKPVRASWLESQPRRLVSAIDDGTPVHAVGGACCAINLRKLITVTPPIMYKFSDQLSEDLDFCAQIRPHGTIFVDPRVRTGHASKSFPLLSHGQ